MSSLEVDATSTDETDQAEGVARLANAIAVGSVLVVLVLWEVMAQFAFDRLAIVFPSLVDIVQALVELLRTPSFYDHLWVSTQELLIAFLLAGVIGIAGGTVFGSNKFLAEAIEPIIYYFSTVPKIVLYPLFIIALGAASMDSKIAMGFFSAIFPITVNTMTGALAVRSDLVKVARIYRASAWERFVKIYLPSTITLIINGLRLGIGVAIIGVLLGELFASQAGIGNQVAFYFNNLQTERMYATLIVVFLIALSINLSLLKLQDALNRRGYGVGADSGGGFGF